MCLHFAKNMQNLLCFLCVLSINIFAAKKETVFAFLLNKIFSKFFISHMPSPERVNISETEFFHRFMGCLITETANFAGKKTGGMISLDFFCCTSPLLSLLVIA